MAFGGKSMYGIPNSMFIAKIKNSTISGIPETGNIFSINIYPNPNTGIFNVNLIANENEAEICVYDVLGNCVLNKVTKKNLNLVDITARPKGIYFIEVIVNKKSAIKKLVIH